MKIEVKFLIIALLAALLAVPASYYMQHHAQRLQLEKSEKNLLEIKLESKQKQLEQTEQERQKLEDEKKKLEEELQAKAKRKADAQLASQRSARRSVLGSGGCEQYRALVAQYSWNVDIALAVMKAESGCDPNAISPTNDHGLFQLNNIKVYDPAENVRIAYEVKYLGSIKAGRSGWYPWSVCKNGTVSCGV